MAAERIVVWGTADLGKPRTRILIKGLRAQNILVGECLWDIWRGVEDKSQVKGFAQRARLALRYLIAYPVLIWRYLRAPRHDAVFIAYMGHFDVLVLRPFASMRRAKIIWDAFLSLYDTVVEDRALAAKNSLAARATSAVEKLASAAADIVILDTQAHAAYFRQRYRIPARKLISVWVGAETDLFKPAPFKPAPETGGPFDVLFYGQFIPLHGVEHIIEAARITDGPAIRWTIIGRGQETEKIKALVDRAPVASLNFIDWVEYQKLPEMIAKADVCLGIFGESDKAARVIPNKVFQILAVGRPLVTRDSPAVREIVSPDTPGVWLVEPGSGAAIAQAVKAARRRRDAGGEGELYADIRKTISADAVGSALKARLRRAV